MWQKVDDCIFDHPRFGLQRWVSTLEYYFGISPFTVARVLLVVGMGIYVSHNTYQFQFADKSSGLVWAALWFVLFIIWLPMLRRVEEITKPGFRNVMRVAQLYLRLLDVVCVVLFLPGEVIRGDLWQTVGFCCLVLCHYCSACDILPPSQRFEWRSRVQAPL